MKALARLARGVVLLDLPSYSPNLGHELPLVLKIPRSISNANFDQRCYSHSHGHGHGKDTQIKLKKLTLSRFDVISPESQGQPKWFERSTGSQKNNYYTDEKKKWTDFASPKNEYTGKWPRHNVHKDIMESSPHAARDGHRSDEGVLEISHTTLRKTLDDIKTSMIQGSNNQRENLLDPFLALSKMAKIANTKKCLKQVRSYFFSSSFIPEWYSLALPRVSHLTVKELIALPTVLKDLRMPVVTTQFLNNWSHALLAKRSTFLGDPYMVADIFLSLGSLEKQQNSHIALMNSTTPTKVTMRTIHRQMTHQSFLNETLSLGPFIGGDSLGLQSTPRSKSDMDRILLNSCSSLRELLIRAIGAENVLDRIPVKQLVILTNTFNQSLCVKTSPRGSLHLFLNVVQAFEKKLDFLSNHDLVSALHNVGVFRRKLTRFLCSTSEQLQENEDLGFMLEPHLKIQNKYCFENYSSSNVLESLCTASTRFLLAWENAARKNFSRFTPTQLSMSMYGFLSTYGVHRFSPDVTALLQNVSFCWPQLVKLWIKQHPPESLHKDEVLTVMEVLGLAQYQSVDNYVEQLLRVTQRNLKFYGPTELVALLKACSRLQVPVTQQFQNLWMKLVLNLIGNMSPTNLIQSIDSWGLLKWSVNPAHFDIFSTHLRNSMPVFTESQCRACLQAWINFDRQPDSDSWIKWCEISSKYLNTLGPSAFFDYWIHISHLKISPSTTWIKSWCDIALRRDYINDWDAHIRIRLVSIFSRLNADLPKDFVNSLCNSIFEHVQPWWDQNNSEQVVIMIYNSNEIGFNPSEASFENYQLAFQHMNVGSLKQFAIFTKVMTNLNRQVDIDFQQSWSKWLDSLAHSMSPYELIEFLAARRICSPDIGLSLQTSQLWSDRFRKAQILDDLSLMQVYSLYQLQREFYKDHIKDVSPLLAERIINDCSQLSRTVLLQAYTQLYTDENVSTSLEKLREQCENQIMDQSFPWDARQVEALLHCLSVDENFIVETDSEQLHELFNQILEQHSTEVSLVALGRALDSISKLEMPRSEYLIRVLFDAVITNLCTASTHDLLHICRSVKHFSGIDHTNLKIGERVLPEIYSKIVEMMDEFSVPQLQEVWVLCKDRNLWFNDHDFIRTKWLVCAVKRANEFSTEFISEILKEKEEFSARLGDSLLIKQCLSRWVSELSERRYLFSDDDLKDLIGLLEKNDFFNTSRLRYIQYEKKK